MRYDQANRIGMLTLCRGYTKPWGTQSSENQTIYCDYQAVNDKAAASRPVNHVVTCLCQRD